MAMNNKKERATRQWITSKPTPWFSTTELLEYLGLSKAELDEYAQQFIEGIHYRYEDPSVQNSQILWRLDLVDEILCIPIAPLEKEAMLNAINNRITCQE